MEILWAPVSLIAFCPTEFPYDQSYGNSMELKELLSAHMDNIWTSHISSIQGMGQTNMSMVWDFYGHSISIVLSYNG